MVQHPNPHANAQTPTSAAIAAMATVTLFSALLPATAIPARAAPGAPVETGVWYDDTKRGAVEITQCGEHLCGHIFWLKKPLTDEGKPIYDKYNTDTSKNTRPVCGIQVLGQLTRQADGTFDNGWVYDPKIGHTFNAAINLVTNDELHVRGYASLKIFGKSLTWTRAPDSLERCTTK